MPQVLRPLGSANSLSMAKHQRRDRPKAWPDWFEPKSYPHFDQPIRDPAQVRGLVESASAVSKHAFLPFIRFSKLSRKFKRSVGRFVAKPRDLKYASHTDSQIFRNYSNLLSLAYESKLRREQLTDVVLAYRRLLPPKCNIHFANDAFRWIEANAPCVALTFDIKDFFEGLDHGLLKARWKETLGVESLPRDHYKVFRAITKYSWVERDEVFNRLGITKKKQKNWRKPICSPVEFREQIRNGGESGVGFINTNLNGKGIPQGSPISALLSNVYMLALDNGMAQHAKQLNCLYLRYSDDILIACKIEQKAAIIDSLENAVRDAKLELHDGPGKRSECIVSRSEEGQLGCHPPLQYLGFTYDGRHVRIRSHTIAKFLRRMRKAVRREQFEAANRELAGGNPRIRRKMLYDRYSHLGKRNFVTGYSADARRLISNSRIRSQLKLIWKELEAAIALER